jgi:hypothetical protein
MNKSLRQLFTAVIVLFVILGMSTTSPDDLPRGCAECGFAQQSRSVPRIRRSSGFDTRLGRYGLSGIRSF